VGIGAKRWQGEAPQRPKTLLEGPRSVTGHCSLDLSPIQLFRTGSARGIADQRLSISATTSDKL
jgi:hypothetical protein